MGTLDKLPSDARWVSLPLVFLGCLFQYMRFAKKPMSAPFHKLSERLARRCVVLGLATELIGLRFLPLCEVYPMNASCLVFLYFWKESKRTRAIDRSEVLACLSALSAWALPFANPADGKVADAMQVGMLMDVMMAPWTCLYVVGMLACSVVVHCIGYGHTAVGSCTPAGMNFGVSAILLKGLAQAAALSAASPLRLELWAVMVLILTLLFGVRSASSRPLLRALEAHDNLSILAFYGVVASAAAAVTGQVVYGEMEGWEPRHQALYFVAASLHCWGMCSLGCRGSDFRGHKEASKDLAIDEAPPSGRPATQYGKKCDGLQMVEVPARGAGAAGLATASPGTKPACATAQPGSGKDKPTSPLLRFSEPPSVRTVDEDAQMEEKLFTHALAPLRLDQQGLPGVGEEAGLGWGPGWPDMGSSDAGPGLAVPSAPPDYDADFEEIMRRFNENDGPDQLITDAPPEPEPKAASPLPDAGPAPVLAFDAQTLLDDSFGVQDDEDELLRSIEDIPGPCTGAEP